MRLIPNEADKVSTVKIRMGELVSLATTTGAEIGLEKVTSMVVPAVIAYLKA